MQITNVRLKKLNGEGRTKAAVSITFDDQFVIHDIRVVEGQHGLFVSMPSRRTGDGEFKDIAHPITTEAREMVNEAVLGAYQARV